MKNVKIVKLDDKLLVDYSVGDGFGNVFNYTMHICYEMQDDTMVFKATVEAVDDLIKYINDSSTI